MQGGGFHALGEYPTLTRGDSAENGSEEEAWNEPHPSPTSVAPGYRPDKPFELHWPIREIKINQRFSLWKKKRAHQGIDLGGSRGIPILAAHTGVVVYAGRAFKGYGKMVLVEYNGEWATLYAHLHKINVKEGQTVDPGEQLGTMGRTGRATGVHLHFELMQNKQPVDPLLFLPDPQRLTQR